MQGVIAVLCLSAAVTRGPGAATDERSEPHELPPEAATDERSEPHELPPEAATEERSEPHELPPEAATEERNVPHGLPPEAATEERNEPHGLPPEAATEERNEPHGLPPEAAAGEQHDPPSEAAVAVLVAAFEEGRFAAARELARALVERAAPQSQAAATARLVDAFALLRLRRVSECRRALERLRNDGPALGPYLSYLEAGLAAAKGECDAAEQATASLPGRSTFGAGSWAQVATCWIRAREVDRAAAAVDLLEAAAASDTRRAEALLLRARIHEITDEAKLARAAYRDVVVRYPLTSAGRAGGKRLEELSRRGIPVRRITPEELLPRAHTERVSQLAGRARRTYTSVIRQSRRRAEVRNAAELGLAELDIVDRRYSRALRRIERVLAASRDGGMRAQARYLEGDILSRRGQAQDALVVYESILAEYPTAPFAAEAALAAARLAYSIRQIERARSLSQWMLEAPEPTVEVAVVSGDGALQQGHAAGGLRDQALWLLAWIERRAGSPAEVMDSYLSRIDAESSVGTGALYWRARAASELGRSDDAETFARMVIERAPTSYYAMAASELLERVSPGCRVRLELPAPVPELDVEPPTSEPLDLSGALVLFQHGLHSEAERVIRMLPAHSLPIADRIAAAWLYRRCGDVHRAAILSRRPAEVATSTSDPVLMGLAFPRPYRELVERAAVEHRVPAALIYAVMRQESAFNARAVSPRNARGLMQMIKTTALRMARDAAVLGFRQHQLFEPEISITLGARYLASLLELFGGDVAAAVASYHAGETTVGRWRRSHGHLGADEFIEEIPFSGTRGYVKQVLAAYGVYQLLYRDREAGAMQLTAAEDASGSL